MKSDSEIERDVKDELNWDPDLDPTDIAVSVKNMPDIMNDHDDHQF